ncbi:hypothetical protein AVEN_123026-1 [Araneus ventricosus]|uniref:Uncharacterized protein n=1 Tax=Araneus ventricosus TaxID=182803 RepID=A0A4Y2R9F1_ARAVE|nr:hypothetical protein AVEN_123026-1 [Araneus ventricosus]
MKSLGGTNITDKVLRTLWLGKMPESIKNILVVSNENLDNLSIMADKIFEMNSTTEIYSAGADNSVMNTVLDKISNLEKQISELNVHRQSRRKYRHSGFNRSNSLSHSRKKYNSNGSYCYNYFKFGDKCHPNKCKSPCIWKASENSDQQ